MTLLNLLSCGDNELTNLDVSQNTLLETFYCGGNALTVLDISLNPLLVYISCEKNQIVSLDFSENPLMDYIYCRENELTYLNIANGNNLDIIHAWSKNNEELTCIIVDETIDVNNPPVDWSKDNFVIYNHGDCCFLDASVKQENNTLTAVATDASYQWINCDNVNQNIEGATGQSFTPTENGDYAVVISQNGCLEISDCYTLTTVGLQDDIFATNLEVYPNPTNNDITIDFEETYQNVQVSITNMIGQIITSQQYDSASLIPIQLPVATGLYLVKIETEEGRSAVVKVIKE